MAYIDQFFAVLVEQGASDLHISEGQPPKMRKHGDVAADSAGSGHAGRSRLHAERDRGSGKLGAFRRARRSGFRLRNGSRVAFPLQLPETSGRLWRRLSFDSDEDRFARATRDSAGGERIWPSARRARAGHRPDWLRQIDHAGGVDRLHKREFFPAHRDDRGADRVRARKQAQRDHATRGADQYRLLSRWFESGAAGRRGHRARRARCAIWRRSRSP